MHSPTLSCFEWFITMIEAFVTQKRAQKIHFTNKKYYGPALIQ